VPCSRLTWPFRQLLSARKYIVSYRVVSYTICRRASNNVLGAIDGGLYDEVLVVRRQLPFVDRPLFCYCSGAVNPVSTRTQVLKLSTCKVDGCVLAMASLDDEVFVVRSGDQQQVEVYTAKGFRLHRHISMPRSGYNWGLAACARHRCLYMSDANQNSLLRANLVGKDPVKKWSVAGCPVGVSVNRDHNVVVACCGANKIREYTTDGFPVREISRTGGEAGPWHAVQLTSGDYVVIIKRPGVVIVVNVDGEVVSSYGHALTSSDSRMKFPTGIAVTQNDVILVADTNNNRLLSINSERGSVQEVPLPVVDGIKFNLPLCLCLDQSRDRLYVGGERRVFMLDNAKLVYNSDAFKEVQA